MSADQPSPVEPSNDIQSTLNEQRLFDPPSEFSSRAHIKTLADYDRLYEEADRDPETFWGKHRARTRLVRALDKGSRMGRALGQMVRRRQTQPLPQLPRPPPRHLAQEQSRHHLGRRARRDPHPHLPAAAFRSRRSSPTSSSRSASKNGDRVAIYMGMSPELAIALLACARIGAPHTVIFGGFSSQALVDRINDSQAVCVITQDGSYRRGAEIKLKPAVDEALKQCPSVKNVVVYKRTGTPPAHGAGPRPLVARTDGERLRRMSRRAARFRTSALPPLHLRHHRQTERHPAHHGRLRGRHLHHHQMGFRSAR